MTKQVATHKDMVELGDFAERRDFGDGSIYLRVGFKARAPWASDTDQSFTAEPVDFNIEPVGRYATTGWRVYDTTLRGRNFVKGAPSREAAIAKAFEYVATRGDILATLEAAKASAAQMTEARDASQTRADEKRAADLAAGRSVRFGKAYDGETQYELSIDSDGDVTLAGRYIRDLEFKAEDARALFEALGTVLRSKVEVV